MKFKLVEDLEQELISKAEKENIIKYEIEKLFETNSFNIERNINGTSYSKTEDNIEASFYINDKLDYSGYVTTANTNFTVKGNINDALTAANKIVTQFEEATIL